MNSKSIAQFEERIQLDLIFAEPGDTIKIKPGSYDILGALSIVGKKNIVLKGSGINSTVLNFKNQLDGAQGLSISKCQNITLEDFSIKDAKGNAIKCHDTDGIIFRRIKTFWQRGQGDENASHGIFALHCHNVLLEYCVTVSATDSGIHIGQSENIIVRLSEVYNNVTGIVIENSSSVDIYGNNVHRNTAGILIYSLPDLEVKKSMRIRIFDNIIKDNNIDNLSSIRNTTVNVMTGTGVLLMATEVAEVFNNTIVDNKTIGTAVVSYFITGEKTKDTQYNPYTSSIYIHDNIYRRKPQLPALDNKIGLVLFRHFFKIIPDIIYDGMPDPRYVGREGTTPDSRRLCIADNVNAKYLNLDLSKNFESWYDPFIADFGIDDGECNCFQNRLPKVELSFIR